jgi:uncharacterized protein (TIGR03435 family)
MALSGALAQEKPVRLTYDVVSIRPSQPGATGGGFVDSLPGGIGYNAENIPIKVILCVIYRIPLRQVVGGPDWLSNERFDVQVRADRPYSIDDLHIMFQNALADRFNLKLHIETKTGPVYVLTVAKSGLKMVPVDPGKDRNIPIVTSPNHESIGSRVPMNYLCFWLGQNLQSDQRQVVDRTGLTGTFDFKLSFRAQLPPDALSSELENLPSIFAAVRDQLGLVLTPQRGPVETLVIDHVERPSEN